MIAGNILLADHNITFAPAPYLEIRVIVTDVPTGKIHETEMPHEVFALALAVALMGDDYTLTEHETGLLEAAFAGFPEECRFIP